MIETEPAPAPRFSVLVLSPKDEAARLLADEASSFLRALGVEAPLEDALPAMTPDGLMVVATDTADASGLVGAAEALRDRAVAVALVADEAPEAAALALRIRKALRSRGAFVLDRQVVVPRAAVGVYGLEPEPLRDRLEALTVLLHHDAERLFARREGWLEPDEEDIPVMERDADDDE